MRKITGTRISGVTLIARIRCRIQLRSYRIPAWDPAESGSVK